MKGTVHIHLLPQEARRSADALPERERLAEASLGEGCYGCPVTSVSMAYRMFISYAQSDWIAVQFIRDKLVGMGANVFLDRHRLEYGERFRDRILPEVEQADELLALLTPSSLQRAWMFAEIGVALRSNVRIVGVLYGSANVEMLQELGVLSLIGDIHHVFQSDQINDYFDQVGQRVRRSES